MVENHLCPILRAAEKISGNVVDCARKSECNNATACVIYQEKGANWESLTQYFIQIANKTAKIEKEAINGQSV